MTEPTPEKKNVYITLHKNWVHTDLPAVNQETGEEITYNKATLPNDIVIDGQNVGLYYFNPLFVNESKFKGENYVDIPLLADREVWLKSDIRDEAGEPVLDENGHRQKHVVKVMPDQIKEALAESHLRWAEKNKGKLDGKLDRAGAASEKANAARAEGPTRGAVGQER